MQRKYVDEGKDGLLYLSATRIPLALIERAFRDGEQPEHIRDNFPSLSLEQVYGAITFCLAEPDRTAAYLRRLEQVEKLAQRHAAAGSVAIHQKLTLLRNRSARLLSSDPATTDEPASLGKKRTRRRAAATARS